MSLGLTEIAVESHDVFGRPQAKTVAERHEEILFVGGHAADVGIGVVAAQDFRGADHFLNFAVGTEQSQLAVPAGRKLCRLCVPWIILGCNGFHGPCRDDFSVFPRRP